MSDRWTVVVACVTALGAWLELPLPRWCAVVLVLAVVTTRAPWLLALAAFVWASSSGAVAFDALHSHARVGSFVGEATLMNDPVPLLYGARVDVRIAGRRYEAFVDRSLQSELMTHLMGERVVLRGAFEPRPADATWLDARHVAGRLAIDAIVGWRAGSPLYGFANGVRRALANGADGLPFEQRALYTGLVFGDDRAQSALLADDFRAGGLGHLLAVSGQNVAFVHAAAGPLLRRVPYRIRLPATLFVLVLFVLVTRAEPSVLRAAVMASVATVAASAGRTAPGVRVLALAVTALLCVDPMLVRAVGFQLSVAASLGILIGSRRVAAALRGPAALREALGVTIAAQLAVAPISVVTVGGVPLASIPANLLALPAAGPVMVWGLTGGVVAGAFGGSSATLLQLPTRGLLWWITTVAAHAGRASLGTLRIEHVVVLSAGLAAAWMLSSNRGYLARLATRHHAALTVFRRASVAVVAVALLAPLLAAQHPPAAAGLIARGVWLWRSDAVVVELDGTASSVDALRELRDRDVGAVDLLVVRTASSPAAIVARDLRTRYDPLVIWAPVRHQIRGATAPRLGERVAVGGLVIDVLEVEDRLRVRVAAL
jgi:competence protein ComEC